jgi:serine/threonine protein kinase
MSLERGFRRHRLFLGVSIGSGAFGNTYEVRTRRGKMMALKRSKYTIHQPNVLEEVFSMMGLCSWYTTKMYDAWVDGERHLNILMEYCDLGNLADYLSQYYPLPEDEVLSIFAQTLLGLDHLHKKNIIHRDIKLDNLLLTTALDGDRPTVKLADFGLCKQLDAHAVRAISCVGTPAFVPPESAAGFTYTTKSDMWSLGVVLYTILTNHSPFETRVVHGARRLVYTAPPHPCPNSEEYRKEIGDCVMALLHEKWKRRPSAERLLRCSVLRETLQAPPWVGPRYADMMWVTMRHDVAPVAVYEECNTISVVVRFLTYGDQVLISPVVEGSVMSVGAWVRVVLPITGFVLITSDFRRQMGRAGTSGLYTPAEVLET